MAEVVPIVQPSQAAQEEKHAKGCSLLTRLKTAWSGLETAERAKLLALPVLLIALLLLELIFRLDRHVLRLLEWAEHHQRAGMLVYVLVSCLGTLLFMPASWFTLAAGAVFGVARGFAVVYVGINLGQCLAYVLGKTLLHRQARDPPLVEKESPGRYDWTVASLATRRWRSLWPATDSLRRSGRLPGRTASGSWSCSASCSGSRTASSTAPPLPLASDSGTLRSGQPWG